MMIDPLRPYETPAVWTPEHVMMRMIWAFDTLRRMRVRIGPAGYGSGWPGYVHEWSDLLAQEETREAERRRRKYQDHDPVLPPDAHDVSLMDEAFLWPLRYLPQKDRREVAIMWWAYMRSRGHEGRRGQIDYVRSEAAEIAGGLRRAGVAVR